MKESVNLKGLLVEGKGLDLRYGWFNHIKGWGEGKGWENGGRKGWPKREKRVDKGGGERLDKEGKKGG